MNTGKLLATAGILLALVSLVGASNDESESRREDGEGLANPTDAFDRAFGWRRPSCLRLRCEKRSPSGAAVLLLHIPQRLKPSVLCKLEPQR
jgi:hypothetical protein